MDRVSAESRSRDAACCALIAVVAISLSCRRASAQDSALVAGSHIRIESADEKHVQVGTFRELTADSLTFSPGLDTARETIPLARVGKIEVSRSRSGVGSVLKGGAIGAGVGLGAILAISGVCQLTHGDCALGLVIASPFVVGGGFLVGALIGAESHSQGWTRVYPSERRASLLIGPMPHGGLAIGISVPFGSAPSN
jgi:hypothetical protein